MQLRVAGPAGAMPELGSHEPRAGSRRVPQLSGSATRAARLFVPRRTKQASRSNQANASATARSPASTTALLHQRVAEGVDDRHRLRHRERQIEPRHPPPQRPQLAPFGVNPVPGANPASTA